MIHSHDLDFSFSGLKTAVLYTLRDIKNGKATPINTPPMSDITHEEIAREFEDAVTDVLIKKTETAIENYADEGLPIQSLILGGGVTANEYIRAAFVELADRHSIPLHVPPPGVSGDNALMIALAGALAARGTGIPPVAGSHPGLRARGNLSL